MIKAFKLFYREARWLVQHHAGLMLFILGALMYFSYLTLMRIFEINAQALQ